MLALIESYLDRIRRTRWDADVTAILHDLNAELGFRCGCLVEFTADLKNSYVIDSSRSRAGWWRNFVTSGVRPPEVMLELLKPGEVQYFDASRFTRPDDPELDFARAVDLLEIVVVPVSLNDAIIGLGLFSGHPALTQSQKSCLQLIVYGLFAQTRALRNACAKATAEPLTPREKEVIRLSADGLTSLEIAGTLGMSARTVNQHVDNVADKLGTRNRAHTVAEAIRNNLLS